MVKFHCGGCISEVREESKEREMVGWKEMGREQSGKDKH